jgi:ATP-dependent protease ClpP protease subunit
VTGARAYSKAGLEPSPLALVTRDDGDVLTIDMFDVIGFDFWGDGITSKAVSQALVGSEASTVRLRINSPGGEAFEGTAIRSLLREHARETGAKILVEIHGLAASAATVIAAAGDEVRIAEDAMFMVHEAWWVAIGEADEMRAVADILDKINDAMASIYSKVTGKTKAQARKIMKAETWMTGAEAVKEGFADSVFDSDTGAKKKTRAKASNERMFATLSCYERTPERLLDLYRNANGEMLVAAMSGTAAPEPQPSEPTPQEPETMNLSAIAIALGLAAEATEQEVLEQASTLASQLKSAQDSLESTRDKLTTAEEEIKNLTAAHATKILDLRIESLVAAEKISPAEATDLQTESAEFAAAGVPQLFEKTLAKIEKRESHSATTTSELGTRPAPEATETVNGRTSEDVKKAAREMGMSLDDYLKNQPAFRELFPEWKDTAAQQSA